MSIPIAVGIRALTGDVAAGPGGGAQAATLATVNSNVGSFTYASITVDGKGRITAASTGAPPDLSTTVILAPLTTARNVIAAATATIVPLTLKTTDDNTTNPVLRVLDSTGLIVRSSLDAVGGAVFANAYIGVTGASGATELTVINTSAADPRGILSGQYSNDNLGSRIHLRKARGTPGTPLVIVTGDVLGRMRFSGYDGANFLQMGSIDVVSTGTIASTRVPTYIAFSVATDVAPSVLTEVARLNINGATHTALDAATATVTNVLSLDHSTSGTPAASYGTGLLFNGQDSTTVSQGMGRIRTAWQTATHASRFSNMIFSGYNVSTEADILLARPGDFNGIVVGGQTIPTLIFNGWIGGGYDNAVVQIERGLSAAADEKWASLVLVTNQTATSNAVGAVYFANSAIAAADKRLGYFTMATAGATNTGQFILGVMNAGVLATRMAISGAGLTTHTATDAQAAAVTNVLTLDHSTSGGTPAASYGTGIAFNGQSSTTVSRGMGRIRTAWQVATDASRQAKLTLSAYDTAERDAIFIMASGSAPMISVFGVTTPIVQPTTAIAAATFVANTSLIANDTATFDGYTIGQVVKALRNLGWLA